MAQVLTGDDTRAIYGFSRSIWGGGDASSEGLHDFIEDRFGKPSLRLLNRKEIEELKGELRAAADAVRPGSRPSGKQIRKIAAICYDLGWNTKAIRGWMEKYFGVRDWNALTYDQANDCINQLLKVAESDG